MGNLDDRCWMFFNMSAEELFERYCNGEGKRDPLICEYEGGETRQFKNTPYWYMIVDQYSMPGIRLENVWDSRDDL